jgi:putative oxidoreductase
MPADPFNSLVLPADIVKSQVDFLEKTIMNKITGTLTQIYRFYTTAISRLQSPLLLVVRLYWGWQFFQTGLGKLTNISKVVDFFASLGIPLPTLNAYFVGCLECIGGALLFLGLGSRIIALPLTFNMLVAYTTADREAFFSIFSDPSKFYAADPFTFLFASVLILVFGPGTFSLDTVIGYLGKRKAEVPGEITALIPS